MVLERIMDPMLIQISIGLAISVLVHECGHAILQKLFSLPVQLIEWGRGPRLIKIGVFEIRLILFSAVYPNGSLLAKTRSAAFLIAAGGILNQWLGMLLIGKTHVYEIPWLNTICIAYGCCSVISLLTIIPVNESDGYYMLKALKGERKHE